MKTGKSVCGENDVSVSTSSGNTKVWKEKISPTTYCIKKRIYMYRYTFWLCRSVDIEKRKSSLHWCAVLRLHTNEMENRIGVRNIISDGYNNYSSCTEKFTNFRQGWWVSFGSDWWFKFSLFLLNDLSLLVVRSDKLIRLELCAGYFGGDDGGSCHFKSLSYQVSN